MIYDLVDPTRRRTIYADSGAIGLASNRKDLSSTCTRTDAGGVDGKPAQLNRLFYDSDLIRVRNVGGGLQRREATPSRGATADRRVRDAAPIRAKALQARGTCKREVLRMAKHAPRRDGGRHPDTSKPGSSA